MTWISPGCTCKTEAEHLARQQADRDKMALSGSGIAVMLERAIIRAEVLAEILRLCRPFIVSSVKKNHELALYEAAREDKELLFRIDNILGAGNGASGSVDGLIAVADRTDDARVNRAAEEPRFLSEGTPTPDTDAFDATFKHTSSMRERGGRAPATISEGGRSSIADGADDTREAVNTSAEKSPVCGEDFCDLCGDCLHCYGSDPCHGNDGGEHQRRTE